MLGKRKCLLSMLLVCFMLAGILLGCSKTADDTDTAEKSGSTKADVTADNSGTTTPATDTGSEFVKNEKTEKLVIFYPYANTSTPEGIEEVKKALEAELKDTVNVTMDWIIIPRENFEEKLNTMLASGDQIDGGVGDMDDLGTMSQKPGLVMPLTELLEEYGKHLKEVIPQSAWDGVKNYKGEITAIPSYNRYYWQGGVIRLDWLEKLGLSVPKTLSDLEAAFEAFKNMDPNIIPAGGDSWFMEPLLAAAVNGGVSPNVTWDTLDPTGEKVINAFTHPEYKKFLELYHRWLDNGWYNKDFLVTDEQQSEQLFVSGKMGTLFTDPHNADRFEKLLKQTDPNAKVTFIPVLSGPGGEAAFIENNGINNIVWVNANGPHPERVVQYFDWLVADKEHYTLARLGLQGKSWVKEGDKWTLPADLGGDTNKRPYFDIFAPLSYEMLEMKRSDEPEIYAQIDEAYKSVPVIEPKLKGFVANYDKIGNVNTIDIWGEMYNIAVKARPLSDYEKLCEEYYNSGGSKIYDELTAQYQEWKKSK